MLLSVLAFGRTENTTEKMELGTFGPAGHPSARLSAGFQP